MFICPPVAYNVCFNTAVEAPPPLSGFKPGGIAPVDNVALINDAGEYALVNNAGDYRSYKD